MRFERLDARERTRARSRSLRCQAPFAIFDSLNPVVSTRQCFDDLRIGHDHVIRSPNDTYYVSSDFVLRPHTSAHQTELLRAGNRAFLCSGS